MKNEITQWIPVADMLAETFGKSCRILLFDLSEPEIRVCYVANARPGEAQLLDLGLEPALRPDAVQADYKANYFTILPGRGKIKTSVVYIKNTEGEIVGALCIHFDLKPFQEMERVLQEFLYTEDRARKSRSGSLASVVETVDTMVAQMIGDADISRLKRRDKIRLIESMERQGIFLIKGMVERVAERLHISKVTVYSYLDEIRRNGQMAEE